MDKPRLIQDLRDLLRLLTKNRVRYLIVGGWAVNQYGYVRMTDDLDILVEPTAANIERVKATLLEFGFTTNEVKDYKFDRVSRIIRFGRPPYRVEIIQQISGVRVQTALANSIPGRVDGVPVRLISFRDLLRNKRAAGRFKDLADVEELLRVREFERRRKRRREK